MAKTCNSCNTDKAPASVPYVVHESTVARMERIIKRLWIALIISWIAVIVVVGINSYERLQYDYSSETKEEIVIDSKDGGNANYVNNAGDVVIGKNNNQTNNDTP